MKLLILLTTLIGSTSMAYDYSNSYQIGNTTYSNGMVDGQYYNANSYNIGNTRYENINVGNQHKTCSTYYIGNTAHTSCY